MKMFGICKDKPENPLIAFLYWQTKQDSCSFYIENNLSIKVSCSYQINKTHVNVYACLVEVKNEAKFKIKYNSIYKPAVKQQFNFLFILNKRKMLP